MALICDSDYLIHTLRLNYLRNIDDPYGPRLITFDPRYQSNPHVTALSLADDERWPELRMSQSPHVSDDENSGPPNPRRVHTGFPGATGLKYTQTIMGPTRIGGAGMRVTGRRASTKRNSVRRSGSTVNAAPGRHRADSEPTPDRAASTSISPDGTPGSPDTYDDTLIHVGKHRSAGGSSLSEIATNLVDRTELEQNRENAIPHNAPNALQDMTHIAAMQARRQRRRAHFSSAGNNSARPVIVSETKLDPEISSSDDELDMSGAISDDDYVVEVEGSLEVENEDFDPDFAPPRIGMNSSSSELLNSATNSALSTSMSSLQITGSARGRGKLRLSPVSETRPVDEPPSSAAGLGSGENDAMSDATAQRGRGTPTDDYFEMVQPPRMTKYPVSERSLHEQEATSHIKSEHENISSHEEEPLFIRKKVPPARPVTSALTAKLASSNTSSNPFTELYALISGRAEVATTEVTVFFPHATKPVNKPLKLTVRKDATVEEFIGFSLWSYWEEGWLPKLDEGLTEEQKKTKLSAIGWILRVAEDDGEVDEDFPAPDRMGKISKFGFDAYAVLEATTDQAAQNALAESKLVRRPSRIIVAKKKQEPAAALLAPPAPLLGPSTSTLSASALASSVGLPASFGISSSHGSQVLLRIRIEPVDNKAVHYSTTISVYPTSYMQEVLEQICRKRRLDNPLDWALLYVSEEGEKRKEILVPLDRTVASLEGNLQLVLVSRSSLPEHGFAMDADRRTGRSIDPNASIFKRISEVQPKSKNVDVDFNVYRRYTVYRKVPMLVARMERTLAIDGDYVHIMPSANKARNVFDSGKTVSYHIKSVVNCSQSTKESPSFKLIFKRDGGDKRYDFEADGGSRVAAEIVATIRGIRIKGGLERSGTAHKSRRSRQVI